LLLISLNMEDNYPNYPSSFSKPTCKHLLFGDYVPTRSVQGASVTVNPQVCPKRKKRHIPAHSF
jgi:hypothetical protein